MSEGALGHETERQDDLSAEAVNGAYHQQCDHRPAHSRPHWCFASQIGEMVAPRLLLMALRLGLVCGGSILFSDPEPELSAMTGGGLNITGPYKGSWNLWRNEMPILFIACS